MKEKLKELTKDTAVYGISTILSRFLTFILVPFYSHVLDKAENGIVGAIYAYIAFLNILYLYGMDSAYMKYASLKMEGRKKDVFSSPFLAVAFTSILISLMIVLFKGTVISLLEIPERYSSLLYYFVLILFLDALAAIPFAYLRMTRKARKFASIKTMNIILNVALNIILLNWVRMGIEAVFIANLAASLFSLLLLLPDIISNLKPKVDTSLLKMMLKFGIPYLPASLASMVIQVIDRPILLRLTDESTVGIYQINYKLGIFMMLFVSMFQYAWQPFFLHNAKEENAKSIFARVLTYFVLAGSMVLVVLTLFIGDLVHLSIAGRTFIEARYWAGLPIVPVVLAGYLFNGIYVNLTAGVFIEEKTKYIPYVTGAGALVNIAVNFLLIPVWGMMGAAFATFISYVVMAGGLYFFTQKFYKIQYELSKLIKIFVSVSAVGLIFYYTSPEKIYIKLLLLLLYFVLLYVLKVFRKEEILSLRNLFLKRRTI